VPVEASDDVIQEVFLQVLLGLDGFEGRSSLGTWIFGIAINVLARLYGAEKKYEPSEPPQLEARARAREDAPDIELELDQQFRGLLEKERKERLRAAIAALPEKMRFCLELRLYQEGSYNEIASLLRISPGTVGAHINEAKRRLSRVLLAQENKEN
jgi:RNA polymerase sigma-70 factor (ECF subfamily)